MAKKKTPSASEELLQARERIAMLTGVIARACDVLGVQANTDAQRLENLREYLKHRQHPGGRTESDPF